MPICTGAGFGALGNLQIIANAGARPTGPARYPGLLVFQADTKLYYFWDGAAWQLAPYTGPAAAYSSWSSPGAFTYAIPSWASVFHVILIGGGAGGMSGGSTANVAGPIYRLGGAGGGAGGRIVTFLTAAQLGTGTATVHVGIGGSGGPSPGNSSSGNAGGPGAPTYLSTATGDFPVAPGGASGYVLDPFNLGYIQACNGGSSGDGAPGAQFKAETPVPPGAGAGGGSIVVASVGLNPGYWNGGSQSIGPGGGGSGGGQDQSGTTYSFGAGGSSSFNASGGLTSGAAGTSQSTGNGGGGGGGAGGGFPNVSGGAGGWPGGGGGGGCGMADGFTGVVGGPGGGGFAMIVALR